MSCVQENIQKKFNLNRHLETTHHDNCGEYECQTCGKLFKRKDQLKRHTETHIRIVCEICLKQLKSKDGLKAHRIGNHETILSLIIVSINIHDSKS